MQEFSIIKMFASSQFLLFLSTTIVVIAHGNDPTQFSEDEWSESHGEIVHSSVFFRHGDRAPLCQYPSDPFKHPYYWQTYWPQGPSNLSETGKTQTKNLGKWFRARYNFLTENQNINGFLNVMSSGADRTIASAKCFLYGFFFPSEDETCAEEVLQNEPLVPTQFNRMLEFSVNCKKYKSEVRYVNSFSEWGTFYSENKTTFDIIAEKLETEFSADEMVAGIKNAFILYNTLHIEALYGLTLPDWTSAVYPNALKRIAFHHLPIKVRTHKQKRLRAGPLINELIQNMESKIHNESNPTFHLYAAHDSTLVSLIDTLTRTSGFHYDISPPYAASLLVELRIKSGVYVVTMLYRDSADSYPKLIELSGCGNFCPFETFKEITANFIPHNWEQECNEE